MASQIGLTSRPWASASINIPTVKVRVKSIVKIGVGKKSNRVNLKLTVKASAADTEMSVDKVDIVLEEVRPYLISDGGNVDVVSVVDGVISLKLTGYSCSANLYKVVRFDRNDCGNKTVTVNILTVDHTNNWRRVVCYNKKGLTCDQIIEWIPRLEGAVAVSEAIHWLVGGMNTILRFDVNEEEFDIVPMAYEQGSSSYVMSQLSVFGGSLCALANHIRWYEGTSVEVWVMKEYGVENSWTRLMVLCIPEFDYDVAKLNVIHVVEDGKLLMKFKNELRVYDLVQKKWEDEVERVTMDRVMTHFRPSFMSWAHAHI